jgi:hypothetical protein
MREELDKALCDKYPDIFSDRYSSMMDTAMCWGFDCGDGWYNIIDILCQHLVWITPKEGPKPVAIQVKEKFGTLRFYLKYGTDAHYALTAIIEDISSTICEECGTNQNVTTQGSGWIRTLCSDCRNEHTK